MKNIHTLLLTLLFSFTLNAQTVTFTFNVLGGSPAQLEAMNFCGDIWGQYLQSAVPIKVNVAILDLGPGQFLGLCLPNGRRDFAGAPLPDTWYPAALANAISGTELNPGEADMDIVINSYYNWYYGLDGNPGANQYDFVSTFLHEMGHGLGIASLGKREGPTGSFGTITLDDFAPYVTTFPFPELDGKPSAYDRLMASGNDALLLDEFSNPSFELGGAFTSNDLFCSGPAAILANAGNKPKLYAPSLYAFGSSLTHLDENSYPLSSGNSLMTPFSNVGEVEHEPGPIVLGILEDIGWNTPVSTTEPAVVEHFSVFPNPAREIAFVQLQLGQTLPEVRLELIDQNGGIRRTFLTGHLTKGLQEKPLDLSGLPVGWYLLRLVASGRVEMTKLLLF